MKVIFIAFANSQTAPLPNLSAEDKDIMDTLSQRYIAGDYLVHRESFTSVESIINFLNIYRDNLAVFHFSGHAGAGGLSSTTGMMYAEGIAGCLQQSVASNALKLVILNGCSTVEQIAAYQKVGVPVIISTNAPVQDKAAYFFSVKLWEELVKNKATLSNAFDSAISNAGVASSNVPQTGFRHLFANGVVPAGNAPLWRIDFSDDNLLNQNPIPKKRFLGPPPPPNQTLTAKLFEAFNEAGNIETLALRNNNVVVEDSKKQIAIVNSIPSTIGVHLQKLICPTETETGTGYDFFGTKRLQQISQVFQATMEFLSIIMISQLWDIHLRFPDNLILNDSVKQKLREYLDLGNNGQEAYNFKSLIDAIVQSIDEYRNDTHEEVTKFIGNLGIFRDFIFNDAFVGSYNYLFHIQSQIVAGQIDESSINEICSEAEEKLGDFLSAIAFIHSYRLTSVQQIEILKLRHIPRTHTEFKHSIITCMQAVGINSQNFFYINSFLDNWGVALLKCGIEPRHGAKKFTVTVTDYLSLSPLIIDRNAFDEKSDIAFIMSYKSSDNEAITFKNVAKPLSYDEIFEVPTKENPDERFDSIRLQFEAFKQFIS